MNYKHIQLSYHLAFAGIFILTIGITGCKSTEHPQKESAPANDEKLTELYWTRQDSALQNFTQDDVKFMVGMICHHAQALVMSRLAPENNANRQVQTLSSRIINAQKDEIETMQKWLRMRNQPVPQIDIDSLDLKITLSGKPYTKYKNMPGVLAEEQLHELARARGSDFDRLFLTYMIEHHKGAVVMVDNLFSKDGAAQGESTYRLASGIQVDQRTEIDRMNLMLNKLSNAD